MRAVIGQSYAARQDTPAAGSTVVRALFPWTPWPWWTTGRSSRAGIWPMTRNLWLMDSDPMHRPGRSVVRK